MTSAGPSEPTGDVRPLSVRNRRLKDLSKLVRSASERAGTGLVALEGPVLLGTAVDAGARVREVFVSADALDSAQVSAVLDRLTELDGPAPTVRVVEAGGLDRVGDVAASQGVLSVLEWRPDDLPAPVRAPFVLVLADVSDPGNAGTLVRSAVAAGADAVVFGGGVDPTNPKVLRSSAGALLGVGVSVVASSEEALEELARVGYRLVGTVPREGRPYGEADLGTPLAVVVGNEAHGLDERSVGMLDLAVTIPMAGPVESLNVAMAGTLVCFEVLRRRTAQGPGRTT